jgi:ParB family chromosome partitioning protein
MPSRRAAGRGAAVIADAFAHADDHVRVVELAERARPAAPRFLRLPLDAIEPDPDQPRREMSQEALAELAASIRQQGILQPIRVREVGPRQYRIIAGERRWRAAKEAGLSEISAVIAEADDDQAFVQALMENVQREDLSAVDRAQALRRLREILGLSSWEETGNHLGLGITHVLRLLSVSRLPREIADDPGVAELTTKHITALTALRQDREKQWQLWRLIRDRRISGEEAARQAREVNPPRKLHGSAYSPGLYTEKSYMAPAARLAVREALRQVELLDGAPPAELAAEWGALQALAVKVAELLDRARPALTDEQG